MIDKKQKLQKTTAVTNKSAMKMTAQEIYEDAEKKYGPGFAQYCVDVLMAEEESSPGGLPQKYWMNDLVGLISQLHTLSSVCNADFFSAWGVEDKLNYMNLLAAVSNDLSETLRNSVDEIKTSGNPKATGSEMQETAVYYVSFS